MTKYQKIFASFLLILFVGFVVRMVTSYVVYGPQSVDDYGHGIIPGIEFTEGKALEIPVWRSPLLVWTLGAITSVGKFFGITEMFSLIRFQLIVLALFSMLLPFYYFWINRKSLAEDSRYHLIAMSFLSLHCIVVFASTRAFGESIAMTMSFIALFMMIEAVPKKQYGLLFFGALLMGIASLYRFQIGVFTIGFLVWLLWKKEWKSISIFVFAGLISAGLQAFVDLGVGRWPLQTLYEYIYVNKDGAVEHSIQPWYNTWITALVLMLVPFSLSLFRHVKKLNSTEVLIATLCAFFVLTHSLIPHKEERFLYPIVPFLLLLLARLWDFSWNEKFEKWFFRPIAGFILILGFFIVPISNSQSGEYEPMKFAESLGKPTILWENDSLLKNSAFYMKLIRPPVDIKFMGTWPTRDELMAEIENHDFVFVTSNANLITSLQEKIDSFGPSVQCAPIRKIQAPLDTIIYRLNPNQNVRRRPSWLAHCWKQNTAT
jgi:hypothetical protein